MQGHLLLLCWLHWSAGCGGGVGSAGKQLLLTLGLMRQ
jgi:hypothetical protein